MIATPFLALCLTLQGVQPAIPSSDPLQINDEMKQFLQSHIGSEGDPLDQLHTLVRVVFQENALNFEYVPQTRTAIETYNHRGGNCISFTFLFLAMARHLGLDARFREVDVAPTWSRVGDVISISGHANAAVFIGNQGYVVDLFPRVDRIQLGGRIVSDERARAHYFSNRAVDQLAQGHTEDAAEYLRVALELDPTSTFAWTNLGVVRSFKRDPEGAESAYLKALELEPAEMVAMSNLASLYQYLGRTREAKTYASKVRRFKLRNPYYHFGLGMQAFQNGQYREAVDRFRIALRLKPVEHNFDLAIAKAYVRLGRIDKASGYLKLAAKNAPDELSKSRYNEKLALLAARLPRS